MFNFKWLTNTPIFRRLFIAFALAAVVPGVIISVLGNTYITTLAARSQAVQTSNQALKITTSQLSKLQQMNSDLTGYQSTAFAAQGSNDPNMIAMTKSLNNEIVALR